MESVIYYHSEKDAASYSANDDSCENSFDVEGSDRQENPCYSSDYNTDKEEISYSFHKHSV